MHLRLRLMVLIALLWVAGGQPVPAQAVPSVAFSAPVLKWQNGGCQTTWPARRSTMLKVLSLMCRSEKRTDGFWRAVE